MTMDFRSARVTGRPPLPRRVVRIRPPRSYSLAISGSCVRPRRKRARTDARARLESRIEVRVATASPRIVFPTDRIAGEQRCFLEINPRKLAHYSLGTTGG